MSFFPVRRVKEKKKKSHLTPFSFLNSNEHNSIFSRKVRKGISSFYLNQRNKERHKLY